MSLADEPLILGRFQATRKRRPHPIVFVGSYIEGELELMLELHRCMGILAEKAIVHTDPSEDHFAPIYCRNQAARFQRALLADVGSFDVQDFGPLQKCDPKEPNK